MRSWFAIVLIGICVSISTLAAVADNLTGIRLPPFPEGIVLGMSGNYLKLSASKNDLDYSNIAASDSLHGKRRSIDTDYNIGWEFILRYMLCAGDVNLNYLHLDTKDKDFVNHPGEDGIRPVNNYFNFPFNLPAYLDPSYENTDDAEIKFNLDRVDLFAGKFFKLTQCLVIHPLAGMRFARLHRDLNTHYFQTVSFTNQSEIIQSQNIYFTQIGRFNGVGPLAGFDADYSFTSNLGLIGHFYASLLLGKTHPSLNEFVVQELTVRAVNNLTSERINIDGDSVWRFVPAFDAKLGAYCTFCLKKNSCSRLILEAGWQVINYYNALDRLDTNTVIQNGFVAPVIDSVKQFRRSGLEYSFNGPYVSLIFRI